MKKTKKKRKKTQKRNEKKRKNEWFCCYSYHIYTKVFFSCVCIAHKLLNFSYLNFYKYIIHAHSAYMIYTETTAHDGPRHECRRCQFFARYACVYARHSILLCLGCLRFDCFFFFFRCSRCFFLSCSKTVVDEE